MSATICALARDDLHRIAKHPARCLRLVAGLGVADDTHAELFDELAARGFAVAPAQMGENVTTTGIDLLGLSAGTWLRLGGAAVIELTGLRNPCAKLDRIAPGLMQAVLEKGPNKTLIRKAGVMAVVVTIGEIRLGDGIVIVHTPGLPVPLEPV